MVYIAVLNYNNSKDTIDCLESLKKIIDVSYKIILVDNASNDDSCVIFESYIKQNPSVIFLKSNVNKGYACGNNLALKFALKQEDMEYCWILNNDTIVDSYSLKYLKEYMDEHPNVGLCGSKLVYEWNRNLLQGYGGIFNPYLATSKMCVDVNEISNIDYVSGAACLVSRKFLETIGLMNEEYFLYYEEIDWAYRAKGKFALSCVPRSIVYHKEGATIGGDSINNKGKSKLADFYSIRNRILFTRKYNPMYLPFVYLGLLVAIINRIKRKQFDRVGMIIEIMMGENIRYFNKEIRP